MNSLVSWSVEPFGHEKLALFSFWGEVLLMFIANLNAQVDFLHTCKLIELNSKIPFDEKPRNSEQEGPVNKMNVSRAETVNQVTKYLRLYKALTAHQSTSTVEPRSIAWPLLKS